MNMFDYQKTSLHGLETEVRIGIDAWERAGGKKQKIIIDIDLYRFQGAFKGKSIKDCLNYHLPFERVTKGWANRPHTDLIETLAEELVTFCLKDKRVDAAKVSIRKPHVYNGRATPSVEFFRLRKKTKT